MRLFVVKKADWTVCAVGVKDGCPFSVFLEGLAVKDQNKVLTALENCSNYGPVKGLPRDACHRICDENKIWQIRTANTLRIAFFYDEDKMMICSHGFTKRVTKTPRAELRKAIDARDAYFKAKARGKIDLIE